MSTMERSAKVVCSFSDRTFDSIKCDGDVTNKTQRTTKAAIEARKCQFPNSKNIHLKWTLNAELDASYEKIQTRSQTEHCQTILESY